jgi:glycosyltransferase involved in cell wall biosynthesis
VIRNVAVIVPAADEADEIGDSLSALTRAVDHLHLVTEVRASVVVVLDDCHDDTAEVVAGFAGVTTVPSVARCVGSARRQGAAVALANAALDELWLANTDADSQVPIEWLVDMVAHAQHGAKLVLGTVRPRPGLSPDVEQAWHAAHGLYEGHTHVHAANLGIAARTYVDLGGWRDLAAHEDMDLVTRAVDAGVPIVRSDSAPVLTSTRLDGRTPGGFASYLRTLGAGLPAVS